MKRVLFFVVGLSAIIGFTSFRQEDSVELQSTSNFVPADTIQFDGEKHFANVQQLTFGGDNAEAYFSFDGKYLIFQKTNPKTGILCDQIWMGKIPTQPGEKFESKLMIFPRAKSSLRFPPQLILVLSVLMKPSTPGYCSCFKSLQADLYRRTSAL